MICGALLGDFLGSQCEGGFGATGKEELPMNGSKFTDDSVLTVAVTEWLRTGKLSDVSALREALQLYWRNYPGVGYGEKFAVWAQFRTKEAYQSYGNGAPMRVSAAGWLYPTWRDTMFAAKQTCMPTHDHKDSINGAQAVAGMIYLGRLGWTLKKAIPWVLKHFKLPVRQPLNWHDNTFYVDSKNTVGLVLSVLQHYGDDYERVLRNLLYIGGDVDTNAAIAFSILEGFLPVPDKFKDMITVPMEWQKILDFPVPSAKPLNIGVRMHLL